MRLYNTGDKVGTRGATFVREIKNEKSGRYIECICANEGCSNSFIARESYVARDRTALCNKCRNKSKKKHHYATIGQKIAKDKNAPILLDISLGDNHREQGLYQCSCGRTFVRDRYDTEVNKRWRCRYCHSRSKSEHMKKFRVGDFVDEDHKILWIEEITPDGSYDRRGTFLNIQTNTTFQATLKHVLYQECRCGESDSYREQVVEDILKSLSIRYIREKSFNGCVSPKGRKLRFDFYLPDYNTLIEVDGEQHYHPVPRFGGEEGYAYLVQCDNIKNKYCFNQSIPLIRISYVDFLHHQVNNDYICNLLKQKGGTNI